MTCQIERKLQSIFPVEKLIFLYILLSHFPVFLPPTLITQTVPVICKLIASLAHPFAFELVFLRVSRAAAASVVTEHIANCNDCVLGIEFAMH